jgi:hypothetical protein
MTSPQTLKAYVHDLIERVERGEIMSLAYCEVRYEDGEWVIEAGQVGTTVDESIASHQVKVLERLIKRFSTRLPMQH